MVDLIYALKNTSDFCLPYLSVFNLAIQLIKYNLLTKALEYDHVSRPLVSVLCHTE